MNGLRKFVCCLTTASAFLLPNLPVLAQPEDCGFLTSPQELNTFENEDRLVIGRVSGRPYVVLLTHDLEQNLPTLRACVPDAFLTSSRLGRYVHIASFGNYSDARELADFIDESLGLDVRVIHRARLGQ